MISVIIPVRNEEQTIKELVQRIALAMQSVQREYEIIAIDDYSTDNTNLLLTEMTSQYPLQVYKKQGLIGKGNSTVEGLTYAKGTIVAVIDADLAYPPEALPNMITALDNADIVVGNRMYVNGEKFLKKVFAKATNRIFGKAMFGMTFDVQSGIKVFKKSIVKHLYLNPSRWAFNLEFLLKANHLGYTIIGYDIPYESRKRGISKMNPLFATMELTMLAFDAWINPFKPAKLNKESAHETEIAWKQSRYKPYTVLETNESAIETITSGQTLILFSLLLLIIAAFLINWHLSLVIFIAVLTFLYIVDLLFNLYLILRSLHTNPEIVISRKEIAENKEWPMYTIMCPLYKEWQVIPQFVDAMAKLDYPKDKLQVQIILEEDDKKTQEEVATMKLPSYFEVLVVPHSYPKTKPKACNYALIHARGEQVVIYDAEDIPEPLQLKKAVIAFKQHEKDNVVCLQAKLNFYNVHQNLLTRMFALEYSWWFDLVLTGLHSINAPIPLGGTSNHFKRESLNLLQGWDPFNVTEDCDLGIRLFKYGYKTMVLDSVTYEEANSDFWGWFKQRSRWIKGYIQTYLVHMRRPHEFITSWSNPHIATFQIIVGGKVLSMWINPFLWVLTIVYFVFRPYVGEFIESLFLAPVFYVAVFTLIIGNFVYLYNNMIGAAKREQWDLIKYAYLVPFYWIMMSIASWKALVQIITKPHYWEKTTHGLHLRKPVI